MAALTSQNTFDGYEELTGERLAPAKEGGGSRRSPRPTPKPRARAGGLSWWP